MAVEKGAYDMVSKRTMLVLAALLLITVCATAFAWVDMGGATYYCTSRRLNVRRGPGTDYDVVGAVTYGQKVQVLVINSGWAQIRYEWDADGIDAEAAWVSSRCISRRAPTGDYESTKVRIATSTGYKNFNAANYYVIVNPTNNYVNMRWEASKTAPVRRIYYYGARLKVLSENANWCQVLDESTGEVGFMLKNLLLRTYDTVPASTAENG